MSSVRRGQRRRGQGKCVFAELLEPRRMLTAAPAIALLKDLTPAGVEPSDLDVLNGKLLFSGFSRETGTELWTSDGTAAGTHVLKDLTPGADGTFVGQSLVVGNRMFFTADDRSGHAGLWTTDGTA